LRLNWRSNFGIACNGAGGSHHTRRAGGGGYSRDVDALAHHAILFAEARAYLR
jgi:hypothetical protein